MRKSESARNNAANQYLLFALFASLVFTLLVVPMLGHEVWGGVVLRSGLTIVLFLAAFATKWKRFLVVLSIVAAAIVLPAIWLPMIFEQKRLFFITCILESAFFTFVAVLILTTVFKSHSASVHSIFGVISAYLLLGLAWAMLYLGLVGLDRTSLIGLDSKSRNVASHAEGSSSPELGEFSQLVYFSFVTMSTLGYGDIAPATPLARTVTWMQSVTGQFYLAVLVAWLVGEIVARRREHVKK